MADARRMGKSELFSHFAERFEVKRTQAREYFDEHRRVIIEDGFAGRLDERLVPDEAHKDAVLDLGCGPGFWTVELGRRGCRGPGHSRRRRT